jgi:hypothetical protein
MVCFDAFENLAIFSLRKMEMFPDFTSMIMAFFQNLLGSITQMINIYRNLQNAIERNDLTPVFFEMGKMFRLIVDFEPIELEGFTKPLLQSKKESDVIRRRHQVF